MLLVVIIVWLVVVGATSTVVGVQGARTFKRARTTQKSIEERVRALEEGGLATLQAKTEQLAGKTAEMQAALERLQTVAGAAAAAVPGLLARPVMGAHAHTCGAGMIRRATRAPSARRRR